jgi:pSer/pThr/pTyr-binding forkhead associated (FHA) protein
VLRGREFGIGPAGLLIGRDPASAQLVVPDPRVSKKHAWVGYRDGAIVAIDRGSTNGTYVNGTRIRDSRLATGDRLTLSEAVEFELIDRPSG